jgi:hypothetical protein
LRLRSHIKNVGKQPPEQSGKYPVNENDEEEVPENFAGFQLSLVIPGCATWRRPGIHTPDRGYGFRARAFARPGMTTIFVAS